MKTPWIIGALLIGTQSASAAQCLPSTDLAGLLLEQHGEAPYMAMVTSNNVTTRMYRDPEDGSWTVVIQHPSIPGLDCILIGGGSSVVLEPGPEGERS